MSMNEQIEIEETTEALGEDEIQGLLALETPEAREEFVTEYNAWFDAQFSGKEE
jgi:hypothetical protein